MEQTKKLSPWAIGLIVVILLGVIAGTVVIATQSKKGDSQSTVSQSTAGQSSSSSTKYKDGTYTETGLYVSPGGAESINVTVTLSNNIITDATVTGDGNGGESQVHQSEFIDNYKSLVVGKNINEVSLSRVAGSSLTSNGFNKALDMIKADAKA